MENQQVPPEGYAELADAAKLANVSSRTIRNWAKAKRIGQRRWPGTTKVVYSVNDIQAELAKSAEMTIVRNPAGAPMIASLTAAISQAMAERGNHEPSGLELDHRDILTIPEAIRLKGYSERYFKELNAAGRLPFYRVPGRRGRHIKRNELDLALGAIDHGLEIFAQRMDDIG